MHCGPFCLWRINFRGGLFPWRIISAAEYFRCRDFDSFSAAEGFLWRKGLPWSGLCLIVHCSLSLPVFLAACFVQSVAGFSLAWSRRISVPSRQGFPLLSSSCFLGDAVIPFTPSGGNDGGQRSSCGAGAGSHFKLSFSLCIRRGKGTAPSRGSLDADI